MREGIPQPYPYPERTPSPERFVDAKGREIEGLPSREERFSRLGEQSCVVVDTNPTVESTRPPSDFFLFVNPTKGTETAVVHAPHWRSVTTEPGGTIWARERGKKSTVRVPYYEVSIKGCGFMKPSLEAGNIDAYDTWSVTKKNGDDNLTMLLGLAERQDFERGVGVILDSQFMLEMGLRTELYWTVQELKEIPFRGELTPVETLWEKGVIPEGVQPFQALRLFRTNTRIEEAVANADRRAEIFEAAFATFNRETADLGLPIPVLDSSRPDHQRHFAMEFHRRMGQNLAVLVNASKSHSHLHSSNITMAAEIADLESLADVRFPETAFQQSQGGMVGDTHRLFLKDIRDAAYSCWMFAKAMKRAGMDPGRGADRKGAMMVGFLTGTLEAEKQREGDKDKARLAICSQQKMRAYGIPTSRNSIDYWMSQITQKMLVDEERLVSLLHGSVDDWGIAIPG